MHSDTPQLGPDYEQLLRLIQAVHLLGPATATQLREREAASHAQFRRRFDAMFARTGSGVVWKGEGQGYVLSEERRSLGEGLEALLREPFMAEAQPGGLQPAWQGYHSPEDAPEDGHNGQRDERLSVQGRAQSTNERMVSWKGSPTG